MGSTKKKSRKTDTKKTKKNITNKKTMKNVSSKNKKKTKKIGASSLKQLNNDMIKMKELLNEYEKLIKNVNTTDKELYKVLDKLEKYRLKTGNLTYYPSIFDKNFAAKLSNMEQFKIYKIPDQIEKARNLMKEYKENKLQCGKDVNIGDKYSTFKYSNTQNLLRNFMSPISPYRSLLIIHGTGVGKTCTAITIAEGLKDFIKKNGKKIYILRHREFHRQLFELDKIKRGMDDIQCTRLEYINSVHPELIENCKKDPEQCQFLMQKIKKVLDEYYIFEGVKKWSRMVYNKINNGANKMSRQEAHNHKIRVIREMFSDSVLIIDEAHHIKSSGSDVKLITEMLNEVLKYSENLRLIMLTATPMFDKAEDITTLINYLLINDKRTPILEPLFDKDGKFIDENKDLLLEKTRGYISYLRGNNPFVFPLRLSFTINFPDLRFKLSNYPKIPEVFSHIKHKLKFLDLVDCKMKKEQQKVYNELMKSNVTYAWTNETQALNFIYNTLDEAKGNVSICYGQKGFDSVMKLKRNKKDGFSFIDDDYGLRFLGNNLYKYSSKIGTLMSIINNTTKNGPVFIYTNFIHGGVVPLVLALEMNGFLPYKSSSNPYLKNKHKLSSEGKGEYIIYTGSQSEFTIASKHVKEYINMGESMINENVKVFIGTESASEGLSLFGYREVHILEPHFNLSLLEQAIGRPIRKKSHSNLIPSRRNVTVYKYVATDNITNVETVDLYKYRSSEIKAISTGIVDRDIIKANSMDCYLNKEGNIYNEKHFPNKIEIETSTKKLVKYDLRDRPFTSMCGFLSDCEYKCIGDSKKKHNKDFFTINHIDKSIEQIELEIIKLVKDQGIIKVSDIKNYLKIKELELGNIIVEMAINIILDKNNNYINNNGINGKIIKYGSYLKFVPNDFRYKNIQRPLLDINGKFYNKDIDLKNYILSLSNIKNEKINKFKLNYDKIHNEIEVNYEKIIMNDKNKKYKFNLELNENEVLTFLFTKLNYFKRLEMFKAIIVKIRSNIKLTDIEEKFVDIHKFNIIRYNDLFDTRDETIMGFIIGKTKGLMFYSVDINDGNINFINNKGEFKKVLEIKNNEINKYKISKLHAVITNKTDNLEPQFKIKDLIKIDKFSIKGSNCINKGKNEVIKYIKKLYPDYMVRFKHKELLCNDLLILFIRKNSKDNRLLLTIEENMMNEYGK